MSDESSRWAAIIRPKDPLGLKVFADLTAPRFCPGCGMPFDADCLMPPEEGVFDAYYVCGACGWTGDIWPAPLLTEEG